MKTQNGFTLLETVIAIAVAASGFIVVVFALGSISAQSINVDQTLIAVNIANETAEKILAQRDCAQAGCGYAGTRSSISSGAFDANPYPGYNGYSVTVTEQEVDPTQVTTYDDFTVPQAGSGYCRVAIKVSWGTAANHSITQVTLITSH